MRKFFERLSINNVYHCTSSSALLSILQSNKLLGNDTYAEGRKYICFTVDPNYKVDDNAIFRMKFNANLLGMKYKLVRYKDPEMAQLDESEYRIYSDQIPNIKGLIDEIEILNIPKRTQQVEELYQYLKANNIPLGYNLQQQVNMKVSNRITKDLYHATHISNLESIKKRGLLVSRAGANSEMSEKGVYFTTDLDALKGIFPPEEHSELYVLKIKSSKVNKYTLISDDVEVNYEGRSFYIPQDIPWSDLEEIGFLSNTQQSKGSGKMQNEVLDKVQELMSRAGYKGLTSNGIFLKGTVDGMNLKISHITFDPEVKFELTNVSHRLQDVLKLGFVESRKGEFTRYVQSNSAVTFHRLGKAFADMERANVPKVDPAQEVNDLVAKGDKDSLEKALQKAQDLGLDKKEVQAIAKKLAQVSNQNVTISGNEVTSVKPPRPKLLAEPKVVQEPHGEGFSVLINGVEYRYTSDKLSAQEILEKVEKLINKGLEGQALKWLKDNSVNYYGGKDKRALTQDQKKSRENVANVKANKVGQFVKSSVKKELKSYTARGGYATFGFADAGVELEVLKARDDGYLVVKVKDVQGIKQLQTKMPREVLWEPSKEDTFVNAPSQQSAKAMPPAEKDAKPQKDPEFQAQLDRIEKFADTQVKELDKDPNWTFKYIDDPQEMKELKMPVPGLLLMTGFINKDASELNQNPVVLKFNKSKTLKRFRNWFDTNHKGMPAKGIIYIDAQTARTKAINALKEAFQNIEFYDGDIVEINDSFYVFETEDNTVVLINEQERIVINLD